MEAMLIEGIAKVLKNIELDSSKIQKETIIREHSSERMFGNVLDFLYNPYIVTNISTKKMSKDVSAIDVEVELNSLQEFMDYLKKSTGTNKNIATVKKFINTMTIDATDSELVLWLLNGMSCKNLKIGITSKTINKAYGKEFIPSFEIMLADKWVDFDKKKNVDKENWREFEGKEVIGTLKIDGNRVECVVEHDGGIKIFSREGKLIEGCVEIENAMENAERGFVYEGEILADGEFENANEQFKKTSSIMRSKGVKTGVKLYVFDSIHMEDFIRQNVTEESTVERKNRAKRLVGEINSPFIEYLEPYFIGTFNKEKLDEIADSLKADGEEGLMVQLADAPYVYKRTKNILKYKSFETADIQVTGMYEGLTGKNIGKLGGIICNYKGDSVKIGGGFTDSQRVLFWHNPSFIIGKIVEIKFFEEFVDELGSYDLRFAIFKGIREDKKEESYY